MERFIVIVGKTILSTLDDRILFTRKDDSCSIEEWLSNTFQSRLLRQEAHRQLNISFLYASDIKSPGYKLISVPMARKLVEISTPRGGDISDLLSDLQTGLTIQLKYGLRHDRIISILEIKPEERGLKCNCTCPGCGLPLVARLGKKNSGILLIKVKRAILLLPNKLLYTCSQKKSSRTVRNCCSPAFL